MCGYQNIRYINLFPFTVYLPDRQINIPCDAANCLLEPGNNITCLQGHSKSPLTHEKMSHRMW